MLTISTMAVSGKAGVRIVWMLWVFHFLFFPIGIAESGETTYELRGKVVRFDDGKPIRGVVPIAFLRGVTSPFTTNTLVGPSGKFSFKKISAAPYRLTIAVPNWGQMEQSIDIGPSFADDKNRIEMEFKFQPDYQTETTDVVSLKQLTIPGKAKKEFREALKKLEKKETAKAINHLERAVSLAPHYSDAWNRLGTISFVSREYEKAERYFRKALEHTPNSFPPVVNMGAALYALGRIEESLVFNQKAVSLDPRDPLANSQLGLSYLALKMYPEAEDHLLKCKSLDPAHFSHPQVTLAELYRQLGNTEAMLRELKEFIFYHPDDDKVPALRKIMQEVKSADWTTETSPENF